MAGGKRMAALGSVVAAFALGPAAPALAAERPAVHAVAIAGDPVVGETLTAVAEVSGDPAPTLSYSWKRCDPVQGSCGIVENRAAVYVPVAADEGSTLTVRVTATNAEGVDRKQSAPTPPIQPAHVYTLPRPAPALRYLRPFPVVRIRGSVRPRGALVTLLRVTAPRRARVSVRCRGRGCPIRRRTRRAGRIRALERFLPAGVRITIRVRRRGYVGKYARIRIRAGKPPARRDACVLSLSRRPAVCPRT